MAHITLAFAATDDANMASLNSQLAAANITDITTAAAADQKQEIASTPTPLTSFAKVEKSLISLACARPLEEAVWRASFQLMEWLMADYGCSQRMAYLLLGINPGFRINVYQMALIGRLQYTAGAEIPKYLVPGTKP